MKRTVLVLLVLIISIVQPSPASEAEKPVAPPVATGSDAPQEGIKVHGRWEIEIRDADGCLVERRVLQNAYVGGGILAQLLLQVSSAPRAGLQFIDVGPFWRIHLLLGTATLRINDIRSGFGGPPPDFSNDLKIGTEGAAFVLSGTIRHP